MLGLMLLAGLPTLPPVFRRLLRWTPKLRLDAARLKQLDGINYRTLAWGWLAMTIGWLVAGFSLWAALRGTGIENLRPWTQWPLYTAAVALATVAGFLAMIPGGLHRSRGRIAGSVATGLRNLRGPDLCPPPCGWYGLWRSW